MPVQPLQYPRPPPPPPAQPMQWQQVEAQGPAPVRWTPSDGVVVAVSLLLPVLLTITFGIGHAAIDRPDPDTATATVWYALTALMGLGALAAVLAADSSRAALRLGAGGAVGAVLGMVFGSTMQDIYGFGQVLFVFSGFAFFVYGLIFLSWVTGIILAAALGSTRGGQAAADGAAIASLGPGLGIAGAAAYHLLTLDRQAELARRAHESPSLGLVVFLVVLAAMVVWRRRSAQV